MRTKFKTAVAALASAMEAEPAAIQEAAISNTQVLIDPMGHYAATFPIDAHVGRLGAVASAIEWCEARDMPSTHESLLDVLCPWHDEADHLDSDQKVLAREFVRQRLMRRHAEELAGWQARDEAKQLDSATATALPSSPATSL